MTLGRKLSKISKPEFTNAHAKISQSRIELMRKKAGQATVCQNFKVMSFRE